MKTIYIEKNDDLQAKINEAISSKAKLIIKKGLYETAPLFIKGPLELEFEEGAILKATTDESLYHDIKLVLQELRWIGIPLC